MGGGRLDRPLLGGRQVGPGEVAADEEQRRAGELGGRVGHAVAEVEPGRVAALAVTEKRFDGNFQVGSVERDQDDAVFEQETGESTTRIPAFPGDENHRRLKQGGGSDDDLGGVGHSGQQLVVSLLFFDDRNYRRGVQNQSSSGP